MHSTRILVVDDDLAVRFGITDFLSQHGYTVAEADGCASAVEVSRRFVPDLTILDYALPDGTALDVLPRIKAASAATPVVILTAHASIDLAVEAIKLGAEQFLAKPVELEALLVVIERIVENQRNRNKQLARRQSSRSHMNPFVGSSRPIALLQEQALRMIGAERPILIEGETGSGKGVLAGWLHSRGPRSEAAIVDLNCAGLSKEFLESELFGHERGAFTGANTQKVGMFDVAHRGTLFLDELGDMDPSVQAKLLKVLEEKRFRRMGDVRDRVVDVQLIAATHRDLHTLVRLHQFRADLYFRVSTLQLRIPPLRERKQDIPQIAEDILASFAAERGVPRPTLTPKAVSALQSYGWPGNIRELRNVLERAMLLRSGANVTEQDLNVDFYRVEDSDAEPATIAAMERQHIARTLQRLGWNVDAAAKQLGLPRSSLYRRLKKYAITIPRMGMRVSD